MDIFGPDIEPWLGQAYTQFLLSQFYTFVLVFLRLSGMVVIGPMFGDPTVPINVRILFVFALSVMFAPVVMQFPGDPTATGLVGAQYPRSIAELCIVAAGELSVGIALGMTVTIVLSGIQLAGEMFDQQTGIALSEIFNPALNAPVTPTGQIVYWLAAATFLTLEPINGHLLLVATLLETFTHLPPGTAFANATIIDLLSGLVNSSLMIAIQIAAPMLAAMSLLSITMGFMGYTVPQINVLVLGFPIRSLLALGILTLTLSGASTVFIEQVTQAIQQFQQALM